MSTDGIRARRERLAREPLRAGRAGNRRLPMGRWPVVGWAEPKPVAAVTLNVHPTALPLQITIRTYLAGEHEHGPECRPVESPPGFVSCLMVNPSSEAGGDSAAPGPREAD